jgi:hypothetical protein
MGKRSSQKGAFGFPHIPHTRSVSPGEQGDPTKRVVAEERGLRSSVRPEYHDLTLGAAAALLRPDEPLSLYASLFQEANRFLSERGEADYFGALEVLGSDEEAQADDIIDHGELALVEWSSEIAERKGALSVEAAAARFLLWADQVCKIAGGDEKKLQAVFALCEAWHWLHMEVTGEHALAVEAIKNRKGLNAGPAAKARRDFDRRKIVEGEYQKFLNREMRESYRRNVTQVSGAILEEVNRKLKDRDFKPMTEGSLRKVLGKIVKSSPGRNDWPVVPNQPET